MTASIQATEQAFLDYVKRMASYDESLALIAWDLRTGAPKQGVAQRSEVIGELSKQRYQMSTSSEMKSFLDILWTPEAKKQLSNVTIKSLQECQKDYELNTKIPIEEFQNYTILQSQAESVWEQAREQSDFSLFKPYLEELVAYKRRFIQYWGYEHHPYDRLLDLYEPDMTVADIDALFEQLRAHIVPLVQKVSQARQPQTDFLFHHFPEDKQHDFTINVLEDMGYDFSAGRLDKTVHPFAIGLNPGDVRITTRYDENDFRMAVFGTIHEGGHALYEQNLGQKLIGTPLCDGTSMGIHESQSLFWENFISRDINFWQYYYPILQQYAPEQFQNISLADFYRAINTAQPSLIRIEADELTYPLHIMVRDSWGKELINGEIAVQDLPTIWNDKMEEYLGIRPQNDAQGLLQDVHWAGGEFGYFPSYALGYMYAAQINQTVGKAIPDMRQRLASGDLKPIKSWLNDEIHQFGKMKKPQTIIEDVTGEPLNAAYLIAYLEAKYKDIYQLQ